MTFKPLFVIAPTEVSHGRYHHKVSGAPGGFRAALVILILMLVGATPRWPHSRNWGHGPSGGLGLILILAIILLATGRF